MGTASLPGHQGHLGMHRRLTRMRQRREATCQMKSTGRHGARFRRGGSLNCLPKNRCWPVPVSVFTAGDY